MIRLILVGFLLMGCGMFCPPHFDNHPRAYTTERNGVRLPWELRVWNPNKTVLKAVYTNTAPGGVVGPFDWERRPDGDCVQMTFTVRPDMTNIGSRDVVQLNVDGVNAFYGVITAPYDSSGTTGFQYVAEGGREFFTGIIPPRRDYSQISDISTILTRSFTSSSNPAGYWNDFPASVAYDAAQVQVSLGGIDRWSFPKSLSLDQILDKLASLAAVSTKVTWGVDANGVFFFREATGTAIIGFSKEMLAAIAIDAKNVVSKASIIVSARDLYYTSSPFQVETTQNSVYVGDQSSTALPDALVYEYADSNHGTYNQEKVFQIGYVEPFSRLFLFDTTTGNNMVNFSNALDGNPTTYSNNNSSTPPDITLERATSPLATLGFEVEYSGTYTSTLQLQAVFYLDDGFGGYTPANTIRINLPPTGAHTVRNVTKQIVRYVGTGTPKAARLNITGLGTWSSDQFRLYSAARLEWSNAINNAAKAQIMLPSTVAQQINLTGIQPPSKTLTLQGAPNGDVIGPTASWKYSLSSSANSLTGHKRTVVDVGNRDGSQSAQQFRIQSATLDSRQQGDLQPFLVPR